MRVADAGLLQGLREGVTELEKLGELAESDLRETLAGKPFAEVQNRVQQLLQKLGPSKTPDRSRLLRSVQVLEQIGSKDAEELLKQGSYLPACRWLAH